MRSRRIIFQHILAVDGDASAAQAMDALEGMPGINTPECLTSAVCPGAPRRRTGQICNSDQTPVTERNI
ncbi:unnamed protein product [Onchocerca flexuosa]|uniref:Response regulator n=1 Tax=Onchocerca flexuosa TaxID=387005 RepID=A0A183H4Y2_9BILA|nr:unnamed protein product [Onchocerca flexuosa]